MNLTSFDYYADRGEPTVGFTRTASLIRTARREATEGGAGVLLFDNGDSLQGTLLGDWAVEQDANEHPLMAAFERLGYDAMALGNHDFGFGLPVLDRILAHAPCPVLCGNMNRLSRPQPWQKYTILTRNLRLGGQDLPVRIGVFSILPPQTAKWEAHRLDGQVVVSDAVIAAREISSDLRRQGCDLVLALAHSGLGDQDAAPMSENVVVQLAALDDIDAIIAGHTHLTVPEAARNSLVHETPVVMPGSAGSHLGVIDLDLELDENANWRITERSADLRAICPVRDHSLLPPVPEDPEMVALFAKGHTQTRRQAAQPVGRVDHALHSYFSFCAVDRGLGMVAAAQAAALRTVLADSDLAALPVLSAAAPSKFGGRAGPRHYTDVPVGDITMRHVSDLHVFPNELCAILANGAQVSEWLEMSAGLFNQISETGEQELIDPHATGHNFDLLHGVTCQIDLSQPARYDLGGKLLDEGHHRIRNLTYAGKPVTPDQQFVVALNNYRANGGGHFPLPLQSVPIRVPPMRIQNILRDYLTGRLPRDPLDTGQNCFSFVRHPGRSAILKTGPDAKRYLHELSAFDPELLAPDAHGFARIRLML